MARLISPTPWAVGTGTEQHSSGIWAADTTRKIKREEKKSLAFRRGPRTEESASARARLREGEGPTHCAKAMAKSEKEKEKDPRLMVQLITILVDYFCVSCRLLLLFGRVMLVGGEHV